MIRRGEMKMHTVKGEGQLKEGRSRLLMCEICAKNLRKGKNFCNPIATVETE